MVIQPDGKIVQYHVRAMFNARIRHTPFTAAICFLEKLILTWIINGFLFDEAKKPGITKKKDNYTDAYVT